MAVAAAVGAAMVHETAPSVSPVGDRTPEQTAAAPGQVRGIGLPILKLYSCPACNAEETATVLRDVYSSNPTILVTAISKTQIIVLAPVTDQHEIALYVGGATPPGGGAVVYLEDADAKHVEQLLKKVFGDNDDTGSPLIKADTYQNAIIIMGTPEQIDDVKAAIRGLMR